MNIAIQTQLPQNLVKQAGQFIQEGWASNLSELMTEAWRRYPETHHIEFMEQFMREDITWARLNRLWWLYAMTLPILATFHLMRDLLREVLTAVPAENSVLPTSDEHKTLK